MTKMEELKLTLHWVTTDYAGNLKNLHVKTDTALKTSMQESLYADAEAYSGAQHLCNLLKTMILASYPLAEIEDWFNGTPNNGEELPESYRKIIPNLKKLINNINSY